MPVIVENELSATGYTDPALLSRGSIQILGTWDGSITIQASLADDGIYEDTGDAIITVNGVYPLNIKTKMRVRVKFDHASGSARIVTKGEQ
jgi:hypothetical protein